MRFSVDDIFVQRLSLLIIMVKATLAGYPLGGYRKQSFFDNAVKIYEMVLKYDLMIPGLESSRHLFFERVKLLCIMSKALAGDKCSMGQKRKDAVQNTIQTILRDTLISEDDILFDECLKVA